MKAFKPNTKFDVAVKKDDKQESNQQIVYVQSYRCKVTSRDILERYETWCIPMHLFYFT